MVRVVALAPMGLAIKQVGGPCSAYCDGCQRIGCCRSNGCFFLRLRGCQSTAFQVSRVGAFVDQTLQLARLVASIRDGPRIGAADRDSYGRVLLAALENVGRLSSRRRTHAEPCGYRIPQERLRLPTGHVEPNTRPAVSVTLAIF